MIGWINRFERYSKPVLMGISIALVMVIGAVDWVTGYELSFFVFYLIPVALAVWFVGNVFGIVVSILSVGVSVAGDLSARMRYSEPFVPVWNSLIAVVFLFVVVGILTRLRRLNRELEERVRQRTVALTSEINERARLERELLQISEREQRRIGHDLHDSLCQHLTGTALAGQVLGEKLAEKKLPEEAAANQVVKLVEEAIDLTRTLARGLHPVELEGEGFLDSFRELAGNISERFKIRCKFECPSAARIRAPEGAIHLYRIAQEAINNAIKHGKAKEIVIRLEKKENLLALSIRDDGTGLAEEARSGPGMGLRIMAYRASVIGASFHIERVSAGGTRVVCTLRGEKTDSPENYAAKEQNIIG
jgi:signal transduction histidine kinase